MRYVGICLSVFGFVYCGGCLALMAHCGPLWPCSTASYLTFALYGLISVVGAIVFAVLVITGGQK